jgi:hypothetical protein
MYRSLPTLKSIPIPRSKFDDPTTNFREENTAVEAEHEFGDNRNIKWEARITSLWLEVLQPKVDVKG